MKYEEIKKIEDVQRLFIDTRRTESHYLEYKEKIGRAKDVTKQVVAFANASGGLIIFGIKESDDHFPEGFNFMKLKDNQHTLENYILDTIQPKFLDYKIKGIEGDDSSRGFFLVKVEKGLNSPYMNSEKIHYIRRDKKSEPMNAQEVREAMFRKGLRDALIEEIKYNKESSLKITKQDHPLHEVAKDKFKAKPDPKELDVRAAIIPFRTEAWKVVGYSGLFSIIQEKYSVFIELYNLIYEFNYLAELFKHDITRVQTQQKNHHQNLVSLLSSKNTAIHTKLTESLKALEKTNNK